VRELGVVRVRQRYTRDCKLRAESRRAFAQVRKIVMSSSPSTRFDGSDICGKAADELPIRCVPALAGVCSGSALRGPASCATQHLHLSLPLQAAGQVPAGVR
jgi:hypothetical protein